MNPSKLADHHVLIEPVYDSVPDRKRVRSSVREYHPQLGYVRGVGRLEESLASGDLVIFVGWKQRQVPTGAWSDRFRDWFILHEDDIEVKLLDWEDDE